MEIICILILDGLNQILAFYYLTFDQHIVDLSTEPVLDLWSLVFRILENLSTLVLESV